MHFFCTYLYVFFKDVVLFADELHKPNLNNKFFSVHGIYPFKVKRINRKTKVSTWWHVITLDIYSRLLNIKSKYRFFISQKWVFHHPAVFYTGWSLCAQMFLEKIIFNEIKVGKSQNIKIHHKLVHMKQLLILKKKLLSYQFNKRNEL